MKQYVRRNMDVLDVHWKCRKCGFNVKTTTVSCRRRKSFSRPPVSRGIIEKFAWYTQYRYILPKRGPATKNKQAKTTTTTTTIVCVVLRHFPTHGCRNYVMIANIKLRSRCFYPMPAVLRGMIADDVQYALPVLEPFHAPVVRLVLPHGTARHTRYGTAHGTEQAKKNKKKHTTRLLPG